MNETEHTICAVEPCQRTIWDDDNVSSYCILHSHNPDKALDQFQQAIDEVVTHTKEYGTLCDFSDVHFPPYYDYHGLTEAVKHDCCFKGAVFASFGRENENHINFDNLHIKGETDFSEARFGKAVSFQGTIFAKNANFYNTKFKGLSTFTDALFYAEANFSAAAITISTFTRTTFYRRPHFGTTIFHSNVNFHNTIFEKGANFYKTRFITHADLRETEFKGDTSFVEAEFASASFFKVDMSYCRLVMVDVSTIDFTGSIWPEKRYWRMLPSRKAVYDEDCILSDEPENIDHLIRLYRRLSENQENAKAYEIAGHFHISSQEMSRMKLGKWPLDETSPYVLWMHHIWRWLKRNVFSLTAWYHHLSGYGERPGQTIFIWLIVIVATSTLVMFTGFPSPGTDQQIRYPSPWNLSNIDGHLVRDFSAALLYILRASTFRVQLTEAAGLGGAWIVTFASIFGPLQLALFVLALRRRFKR